MARKPKQPKQAKQAKPPKQPKQKKPKKEKPEKPPKMRSSAPRRFGAWVLVIFMLSMIAFGMYKIIKAPTERAIESTINKQVEAFDKGTLARTKAVNFAEKYAIAYFTFTDSTVYNRKMQQFYAKGVTIPAPENQSQVLYVGTTAVAINGNDVEVDVACQVAYSTQKDGKFDLIQFPTIRVPIHVDKKGNCAVTAIPIYIGEYNNPKSAESGMNKVTPTTGIKDLNTINETILNFFTVYYGGTSSELKYYVTKNYGTPATTGLGIEVDSVTTKVQDSGDKYDVECSIVLKNSGMKQTQHCYLEIVKGSEGRYYINKLSTTY